MVSDNRIDNFYVNSRFSNEHPVVVSPQKLCGRVLIAEDDLASQRLLDAYLGRLGINITMVSNGKELVEQAQNGFFDMILMDVQMPVMDGLQAVKILRSSSYSQPIVALTANVHKDYRQSCMEAGFNEFLTKPIDLQRLYRALELYIHMGHSRMDHNGGHITVQDTRI